MGTFPLVDASAKVPDKVAATFILYRCLQKSRSMLVWYSNLHTIPACFARLIAALCAIVFTAAAARAEQPFMTLDEKSGGAAWWVVAEFHPFTTEVRGIPANKIRKSWCKATEFRKDLLPKEIVIDQNGDSMEGHSFALEGNFDGSASKQMALVGVYEECSGKTGRFFMILDQPAVGRPKVRFLSSAQDPHPFAALTVDDKTIIVWACLECDNYAMLEWDRKRRKFVWLPSPAE